MEKDKKESKDISAAIEAILFWKAQPVSYTDLTSLLKTDLNAIKEGLQNLEKSLVGRGLSVVQTDQEVMLGTSKEMSPIIEQLTKDELSKDLGKAGIETLSIIMYQGPISRADIDYIRGVNSQFIIRNLLIRGLIERVENPADARSFLYKSTLQLLAHMGLTKIGDLPDYDKVKQEIESYKLNQRPHEQQNSDQPIQSI